MLFVKDRLFYKRAFMLLLPMIFQNVMSLMLQLSDTVMLGLLPSNSETAISAANLANKPYFVYTLFLFGIVSGATVLISQYWGKGDTETISRILGIAMTTALVLGSFFTLSCYLFAPSIMSMFSKSSEVIRLGAEYMRTVAISYIPAAVILLLYGILKSTEQVTVPLVFSGTSIILNIVLNYILIFGKFGLSEMGVRGAAIATAISKLTEFVLVIIYMVFFEKKVHIKISKLLDFKKKILMDFVRYSSPVILNETAWGLGITVHAAILGNLGEEQYAAYTLANIIEQIAMLAVFGFANASGIIIGKEIGAGRSQNAYPYAKTLLSMAVISGFSFAFILMLFREKIIGIFNVSDTTKMYAGYIIIIMFFLISFKSFNTPAIVGVIRAGGDTVTAMLTDFIPMWLIAIPLGLTVTKLFDLPVYFVYALLMSDEALKAGFILWRLKSKRWIKNLTVQ